MICIRKFRIKSVCGLHFFRAKLPNYLYIHENDQFTLRFITKFIFSVLSFGLSDIGETGRNWDKKLKLMIYYSAKWIRIWRLCRMLNKWVEWGNIYKRQSLKVFIVNISSQLYPVSHTVHKWLMSNSCQIFTRWLVLSNFSFYTIATFIEIP